MGAGLSGLACAIILEQNHISPDIYEKRAEVDDRFINCEILLSILTSPINDAIKFFSKNYNIYLKPQNNINKLIIHSENEKAEITGHLGFTNLRGRIDNSLSKQLAEQVKSSIVYNSQKTYKQLSKNYSHIILATGDAADANKLQKYNIELTVTLKGAIIEGDFDPHTVQAWLNNKLAPKGYGYLIPLSRKKANIVIGIPDSEKKHNLELLWNKYIQEVQNVINRDINNFYNHFEINNYIVGLCETPQIGNTYFVGNNFGTIMPFLGFGQVESMLTGIYAAYDITGKGDYKQLTRPLKTSNLDSFTLRKSLEKMNNKHYDLAVKVLDGYLGQKIFNSKFNFLKLISRILRPFM